MGKVETMLKSDKEEEQPNPLKSPPILLGGDDVEEPNEDLSLKIVEKSVLRACNNNQNDAHFDLSQSSLLEAAAEVVQDDKKEKLKKDEMMNKGIVAEFDSVVVDEEVEKAGEFEILEIDKLVEGKVDISDNIVLRKLLRGPRYFDPPDSSWGACYNCGEGHTTVNCTSAKRRRPCFVCGSLEHNAKQCTKGKDCFICKRGGHRAKDCPDKKFSGGPHSAKICLKCGQSGHEMFSCKSDYSSDDLKEIQCYICKSFGHLSCFNYSGPAVGEVSCYRCGQSGHTGLACTSLRGEPNGTGSPNSCYRCGEGGHFARECTSSSKAFTRSRGDPNGTGSPSSCYRCGEGGHFARECTSSAKACTRLRGEPNDMGSPSSCYKCGEEGHFARECTSSAKVCTRLRWEPNDMESPSSCYKCGEEGHFARECTMSSKTSKRKREFSTPKQKHLKQRKNYFEGRSLPRDPYKTHKRDKPQYERSSTPSKSKRMGGWITEDPGDFPNKKARTNNWKSPQTPTSKNKKFSNSTDRSYASNSRASMKFRKL